LDFYSKFTVLDYDILTAFVLATALLSIAPGPDNIFVLTQSLTRGIGYGIITTAGLMTGCLVHTSLLAFGLAAVIRDNPFIFFLIRVFGALYMFYLAFTAVHNTPSFEISNATNRKKGLGYLYRQGFIMNVLNPKVAVFFLAFFPAFLFSTSLPLAMQFYILGGLFILVSFSVFAGISLLAGVISGPLRSRPGIAKALQWVQVVVFSGIGIYLLFSSN
jgi:threonine/homoserine/homoserine lactone efflux protein